MTSLRLIAVSAVLAAITAFSPPALAEGLVHELSIGVLAHDVPDLWSGFRAEPNSVDINVEAKLSPSMALFFGTLRPAVGASINTEGATSHAYVDARLEYELTKSIWFGFGVGAAIHDGQTRLEDWDRKALGSRVLFHIPFELGFRLDAHNSVSAYFEHTSNANTQTFNEGLDRLGIRYGYRF